MYRSLFMLSILLTLWLGCADSEPPPAEETATSTPAAAADPAPASSAPADAPFVPLTSRDPSPTTAAGEPNAEGTEIAAPGAVFRMPASWQPETPSSSMRLAQASVPGEAGAGQLTVFFFGVGGGGGLESNLARWVGQVEVEPGSSPVRNAFTVGNFKVTWVEVEGTLKPSTMGSGSREPQPGSRLLGAVVEGPGGPWYFKLTGPAATLEAEKQAFLEMLRSVRL